MSHDCLGVVRWTACTDSQRYGEAAPCLAARVSDNPRLYRHAARGRLALPCNESARHPHDSEEFDLSEVQALIATTLKVPPAKITPTTQAEDLPSWDSLGQVNLIMALEQTFDVYIEVEEFANLNSVPAILDHLGKNGVS